MWYAPCAGYGKMDKFTSIEGERGEEGGAGDGGMEEGDDDEEERATGRHLEI